MPKSDGYVSPEYLKMIASFARPFKNETFKQMNLKTGDVTLDIGCGPAIDTIEMAKITSSSGKVFGIDIDEEMIEIAEKECKKEKIDSYVSHKLGTAINLEFNEKYFDSIRAERLFQVMPLSVDRNKIFKEIKRVLKPNGVFLALDTDWATATVDFPDINLERKLMNYFAINYRPDGIAGRTFYRLFKENDFKNVTMAAKVFPNKTLDETPFGDSFIKMAITDKVISKEEGLFWINTLRDYVSKGIYYSAVNYITVFGEK